MYLSQSSGSSPSFSTAVTRVTKLITEPATFMAWLSCAAITRAMMYFVLFSSHNPGHSVFLILYSSLKPWPGSWYIFCSLRAITRVIMFPPYIYVQWAESRPILSCCSSPCQWLFPVRRFNTKNSVSPPDICMHYRYEICMGGGGNTHECNYICTYVNILAILKNPEFRRKRQNVKGTVAWDFRILFFSWIDSSQALVLLS